MKSINTLVSDIYDIVKSDGWYSNDISKGFVRELDTRLVETINRQPTVPSLRLSQMGPKCPKQLWCSIHTPMDAEPLPPWAKIKYTYGHILEAYVISLAKAAGHEVLGEQDELVLDGIVGHRDCVIDGNIVDVKSSSSIGFSKFRDGSIATSDNFGYLDQLDGYLLASRDDPLVRNKRSAFLLAIDKQLGKICLYEHYLREESIRERIAAYRAIVTLDRPPECTCEEVPDGKSGNYRLGVTASYNAFKYSCWPKLRCFLYSDGPRYLTKVVRKPDVPEIDRNGKIVYN
jgi:hypothetical protein